MIPAPFEPGPIREILARLTPGRVKAQENLTPPGPGRVFLPPAHRNAFDWDTSVVIGMRGVGKSLWTAALTSAGLRGLIADEWHMDIYRAMQVRVAFGLDNSEAQFPTPDTLAQLGSRFDPRQIWKAILLEETQKTSNMPAVMPNDWMARVGWVNGHPEAANRLIDQYDTQLAAGGQRLLLVFDTLERLSASGNWQESRRLLRGALEFALSLRSTRAIRAKLFMRPDMYDDPEPWAFPESSKLKQGHAKLSWSPLDLFSLILQLIVNDPDLGYALRAHPAWKGVLAPVDDGGARFRRGTLTEAFVRPCVEAIAGPYMGKDKRRGVTYVWIPNHLADSRGGVSPRSLLIALGKAAEESRERYSDHEYALHYRAINAGVTAASEIRVDEIREDYPWIQPLIEAMRGLTVPCAPDELITRWTGATIASMQQTPKLPPRRFTTDPVRRGDLTALIDDLEDLAVISRAERSRINIPDIFRVAAGIKRRGGVPPAR